jgi:hypothetical protein
MNEVNKYFPLLLSAACFCLVGCDTLNYTQYVVTSATPTDRAVIKKAVEASATTAGLVDKTETAIIPNVIVFYVEPVPHFPTTLGARMVNDMAVVDLSCFHPGAAKPPAFQSAESLLTTTLSREFGTRLTMPDRSHMVPMK